MNIQLAFEYQTMIFSRQFRLLKPEQFQRVFQHAIRSSDRCFRVLARDNAMPHYRLGMAVSKKVCPRAVDRNRIRRVVRESFRIHLAGQLPRQALDVVVLPSAMAVTTGNADLQRSLVSHWRKLSENTCNGTTHRGNAQHDPARSTEDRE